MNTGKTGKRPPTADRLLSDLAGVIGHELNNIAVPLQGFADLALQEAGAGDGAAPVLEEIKIAVARLKALASDLESLGTTGSDPAAVAIATCMPTTSAAEASAPGVDWCCSPSTEIEVDAVHAHRALQALAAITVTTDRPWSALPVWRVALEPPRAARCAACGAALPRKPQLVAQAFGSRSVTHEALRDPFGSARVGRAGRRLKFAVLVHSAHGAGGHVLLDESAVSLSIAFPIA